MSKQLADWLATVRARQARHAVTRAAIEKKHPAETVREQLEQAEERAYIEGFNAALDELAEQLRAEAQATLDALPEVES